jgi:hypothetical protein
MLRRHHVSVRRACDGVDDGSVLCAGNESASVGSGAFSTFLAITLLIFELQISRSEHPNRNAEIHQTAGSRALSSFAHGDGRPYRLIVR